jgi:hypothetical protein
MNYEEESERRVKYSNTCGKFAGRCECRAQNKKGNYSYLNCLVGDEMESFDFFRRFLIDRRVDSPM